MYYFNYYHCCAGTLCHIIMHGLRVQNFSSCARGILGHVIIRSICKGQSRCIYLQEAWMVVTCFELIGVGQQGLCQSGFEEL